jgi:hypothetical protein
MVHAVAVAAPDDGEVIDVSGEVRQELAELETASTVMTKRLHGREKRILRDFATGHDRAKALGERRSRMPQEGRLRIEEIDVARPTVEENPHRAPRLRRDVRDTRRMKGASGRRVRLTRAKSLASLREHRGQGDETESTTGATEELASRKRVE